MSSWDHSPTELQPTLRTRAEVPWGRQEPSQTPGGTKRSASGSGSSAGSLFPTRLHSCPPSSWGKGNSSDGSTLIFQHESPASMPWTPLLPSPSLTRRLYYPLSLLLFMRIFSFSNILSPLHYQSLPLCQIFPISKIKFALVPPSKKTRPHTAQPCQLLSRCWLFPASLFLKSHLYQTPPFHVLQCGIHLCCTTETAC